MRKIFLVCLVYASLQGCNNKPGAAADSTPQTTASDPTCDRIAKKQSSSGAASSLALAGGFVEEAQAAVVEKIANPLIQVVPEEDSYTSNDYRERVHFTFQLANGTPLCPYSAYVQSFGDQLRISETLTRSVPANVGIPLHPETIPKPDVGSALSLLYARLQLHPSDTEAAAILLEVQNNTQSGFSSKSCLAWQNGQWVQAWDVEFVANTPKEQGEFTQTQTQGLPLAGEGGGSPQRYHGIATEAQVLAVHARFFSLTGAVNTTVMTQAFPASISVEARPIANMSDGGTLCSPDFATIYDDGRARAYNSAGQFVYPPLGVYTQNSFFAQENVNQPEASFFANVNNMLAFYKTIGADDTLIKDQIKLVLVTGTDSSSQNTALYLPKTATDSAQIQLGTGDGKALYHLRECPEVPGHELGHHVIYRYLTNVVRGEPSSVIHEGVADAFVFMKTNNPCLGEGICPAGGTICNSQACLRNADKGLKFGQANFPTEFHQVSQVVSGLIWAISRDMGTLETAKMLYLAVSFFDPSADYQNLIEAMMMADKSLYGGTHSCKIFQTAVDYGFSSYLGDLSCDKYAAAAAAR